MGRRTAADPAPLRLMPAELPARWRAEAEVLRKNGDERGAFLKELHAQELEDAVAAEQMQPISIREASELGGYTEDHLREQIREGKIPNAGRPGSPRIRRGEVPVKPGHKTVTPPAGPHTLSPGARARRIARSLQPGRRGMGDL